MDWYTKSVEEIYKYFESDIDGLDENRVNILRVKYGENKLPEGKRITYIEIFFNQFKSPLIYILLASVFIVLFLGDMESAVVIGAVLLINSVIGTIQEGKAEHTLNALRKFVVTKATVLRSGTEMIVDDSELVLAAQTAQQELLASDTVAQPQVEMIHCYMHLTEEMVFL